MEVPLGWYDYSDCWCKKGSTRMTMSPTSPRARGRMPSIDADFYADLYLTLLGGEWRRGDDVNEIHDGSVSFDLLTGKVYWIDLAPEYEAAGEERTMRIPPGTSIGASVGILKGLADVIKNG